jgi:hypothetical protein
MGNRRLDLDILKLVLVLQATIVLYSCTSPDSQQTGHPEGQAKTIVDLKSKGARALSTSEIQELLVGKTIRITDLRDGGKYDIFFGEDGTRTIIGTVTAAVQSDSDQPSANRYEIKQNKLYSSLGADFQYYSEILMLDDHYYGARSDEGGMANYEILGVAKGRITIDSLLARGAVELSTEELQEMFVGKPLTILHLVTGEIFKISYSPQGVRTASNIDEEEEIHSTYRIQNGRLEIQENGDHFHANIYRLGVRYYGARSQESGFISYEILSSEE